MQGVDDGSPAEDDPEDDLFDRPREDGPAMRRCISRLSGSCHVTFLSEWSGQRYCPACREFIRRHRVMEGPEGGEEDFSEENFRWLTGGRDDVELPPLKSKRR